MNPLELGIYVRKAITRTYIYIFLKENLNKSIITFVYHRDEDHTAFVEKYGLKMTLLSDVGGAIRKAYAVSIYYWKLARFLSKLTIAAISCHLLGPRLLVWCFGWQGKLLRWQGRPNQEDPRLSVRPRVSCKGGYDMQFQVNSQPCTPPFKLVELRRRGLSVCLNKEGTKFIM